MKTNLKLRSSYNDTVAKVLDRQLSLVLPQETTPVKTLPKHINRPPYAKTGHVAAQKVGEDIEIKNDLQILGMRKAGKMARKILNITSEHLKVWYMINCLLF